MKGKSKIACLILLAGCGILAGCAHEEPEPKIQITLMHGWNGEYADHKVMRNIYEEYQEKHPEVELLYDAAPDVAAVIDKANDMLAADEMPDIISTNGHGEFLENAIKKGMVLDLAPYIERDEEFKNNIHPAILSRWMQNGKLYTIPDAMEVMGYWYNEDILKQAGVTKDGTPDTEVVIPTTWEEFWQLCEKVEVWSRNMQNDVHVVALETDEALFFTGARIGGEDSQGSSFMRSVPATFRQESFSKSLSELKKFYGYSVSPDEISSKYDAQQLFCNGKTALYMNGIWADNSIAESSVKSVAKYANYPGYDGKSVSYVSPSSGYVIGNTGNPKKIEACVEFLKYILSEEVQRRIACETGQVPSNPNIDINWLKKESPMLGTALEEAYSAEVQIWMINSLWSGQSIDTFLQQEEKLKLGEIEIGDFLDKMERSLNE